MKKLLLLFVFAVSTAFAQNPDCQINFGPWTDTNVSSSSANGVTQCTYWVMTYQVTGFSAISLQFESATGTNVGGPGAFGAYSGTVSSGINPSTSVSCGTVTNCTATFTGQVGWYRINFPTHAGSGSIQGVLKGYKVGYPLGGAAIPGGGCVGTVASPCIVAGPDAAAAASTKAPVQIGLNDGSVVRQARSDTTGRAMAVGAAADGAAVAGNPVLVGGQDGTNAQTILTDTTGRPIVAGAAAAGAAIAGNPVLVGGSDGTNARAISTDTAGRPNVNINGTVPISGPVVVTQSTPSSLQSQVTGPAASGAGVSGNPVLQGGTDGTNAQTIKTDTNGNQKIVGVDANLATTTVNPVLVAGFRTADGKTYAIQTDQAGLLIIRGNASAGAGITLSYGEFIAGVGAGATGGAYVNPVFCSQSAVISVTAGNTTELVALTASQTIHVCAFSISESLAGTAQFVYGTGSNCGTGTANLTGAYNLATGTGLSVVSGGGSVLFNTASANALCLTAVTGNVTGHVSYAKY